MVGRGHGSPVPPSIGKRLRCEFTIRGGPTVELELHHSSMTVFSGD